MATQVAIRDVDSDVFREFKAEAVHQGLKMGSALTLAMEKFLSEAKGKKSLLEGWKPTRWGKGTEHLSEQVDDVMYGDPL
ncbi:hypothetical protein HYU19_05745 [Candidatus Woesearchaeota archaeon]|nr:hypothetical protein [Candidatus Woesearchaeota archaeon]